jgi:hypothetical protein
MSAFSLKESPLQFAGQSEHAVNDLVQLGIRSQHLSVEIIFFHLQLCALEREIHGVQLEILTFHLARFLFQAFTSSTLWACRHR